MPAGITADEENGLFEKAQRYFVGLAPTKTHLYATGSDHCIRFSQPDLVVDATELVIGRVIG